MAVALISVIGAGLLGFLGILVQYLLRQNAQRHDEHAVAMGAVYEQGLRMEKLHTATSELIQQNALAAHQHSNELHREAMGAMAAQGLRMEELHTRTMDAVAALDREHREHREKLHIETMAEIAALSERTAVLEAKADRPEPEAA